MKGSNIVFIGGTGRSGTNILKKILGNHSKVGTLPFEHRFTIDPRGIVDFYNSIKHNWSPFYYDYKLRDLESFLLSLSHYDGKRAEYAGWELDNWFPHYSNLVHDLIKDLSLFRFKGRWPGNPETNDTNYVYFNSPKHLEEIRISISSFYQKCINNFLNKQNKTVFVEDNTWNILYALELQELFPESKLIHVVRDPRDVVSSFLKQKWTPNTLQDCIVWYKGILDKWKSIKSKLNDNYLEIKLENLVENPKNEIEALIGFIGLDYNQNLHKIDLSKSNSGRWKKELTKKERSVLGKNLKEEILNLGY